MGNLTPDVYHLLKRNPHVPSILALTKTDLMTVRHNRHFKKFDQKHLRAKTVMDIIDKITEGHVKGVQYKGLFHLFSTIQFLPYKSSEFSLTIPYRIGTGNEIFERYAIERTRKSYRNETVDCESGRDRSRNETTNESETDVHCKANGKYTSVSSFVAMG